MKYCIIRRPYLSDQKANLGYVNLRKTKQVLRSRDWKHEVTKVDTLECNLETLLKGTSIKERRRKRNQLPLILRRFSTEINEVLQLLLSLRDLETLKMLGENTEQMVINRANYVFSNILESIERNEKFISGKYTPAN